MIRRKGFEKPVIYSYHVIIDKTKNVFWVLRAKKGSKREVSEGTVSDPPRLLSHLCRFHHQVAGVLSLDFISFPFCVCLAPLFSLTSSLLNNLLYLPPLVCFCFISQLDPHCIVHSPPCLLTISPVV